MNIYHLEANGGTNTGVYVKNICDSLPLEKGSIRVFTSRSSMHGHREVPVFGGYGRSQRRSVKLAWYVLGWCRIFSVFSRVAGKKVLHSHWLKFSPLDVVCLSLLKLLFRELVLVHTVHNILPHEESRFDAWFFKGIYARFDWLIFHGRQNAEDFQARFGHPQARIAIIPHFGYDTPQGERPPLRGPSMLFFGAIRRYKGLEFLLNALSRIDPGTDFSLTVAGTREYDIDGLVERVARSSLAGKVRWKTTWIEEEDLADLFGAHSIAVFPYERVDSSGALIMAMGCGKIVIASNIGAFTDVVRHNESGILFEAGSEESLAETLRRVLSDVGKHARLGRNARRQIREEHSKESIGRRTAEIYLESTGRSQPGAESRSSSHPLQH